MTTGHVVLLHPGWLWLLPLLAGAALLLCGRRPRRDAAAKGSPARAAGPRVLHPLAQLLHAEAPHRWSPQPLRALVSVFIFACLVLALAEPVRIGARLPDPPRERDVVFIVDTSVGMVLRDYLLDGQRVDRMSLLRAILQRFIAQLHGARLSIVVFADRAYTLLPLTKDYALAQRMITRIDTGIAGRSSAVGDAIALAVKEAQQAGNQRRALVLLSDVSAPTGVISAQSAAQLAAAAHLPLYTIAIGATTYRAEEQRTTGLIYHPVDFALLRGLAQRTGARSYQAGDPGMLTDALHDIARREATAVTAKPRYYTVPLYMWPLLAGAGLLSAWQITLLLRRRS